MQATPHYRSLTRKKLSQLNSRYLPFAGVAGEGVQMGCLLRLSLFQVIVGMIGLAFVFGTPLENYSPCHLILLIQSAAVVTMLLNGYSVWKQEARVCAD